MNHILYLTQSLLEISKGRRKDAKEERNSSVWYKYMKTAVRFFLEKSPNGVEGIPTEKFTNLISNIQNNTQNNAQANTPRNNPSPTNEPTPVIFQNLEALLKAGKWRDADEETWKLMLKLTI